MPNSLDGLPDEPTGTVEERIAKLAREAEANRPTGLFVAPYMIEPMTRADRAGYVPLSTALMWIMTNGGAQDRDLNDVAAWQNAVSRLLPLIATGEIEINARRQAPDRTLFDGISISTPFGDSVPPGRERWILAYPYVDLQHWDEGDMNDQLYLHGLRQGATFTHLTVRKSDVLSEFPYSEVASAGNEAALTVPAGARAIPSKPHDTATLECIRLALLETPPFNVGYVTRDWSWPKIADHIGGAYQRKMGAKGYSETAHKIPSVASVRRVLGAG
ncbi:hypothetical protein SAMN05216330_104449 [Bradyrhizobium sp. Ghvi]|uniref:hypothetical protein n=1 Tax=Bradyrhizobium sp. Ghvi TaxID=1855319 RepID=UPI0008E4B7D5|nr:hypothetical protein [Bradyrhizobium sp. Ghvi]SFO74198.1 hypothetical protein SAMN05216330_104449 [Bradyrhizobium sp. Ghvi]